MATPINWPSFTKTWHSSSYPSISPTRPELSLAGKIVIVTGGGSGIGAAIAHSVARAGASHLAIIGRRPEVLSKTAEAIKASTATSTVILPVTADLTKPEEVSNALTFIRNEFGNKPLDILISNAGFFSGPRKLGTEPLEEWMTNIEVNIKALVLIILGFLEKAAADATIINISTAIAHVSPIIQSTSYSTTKLAGTKFIEHVAAAHPEKTVINVHPGQVAETKLSRKYFDSVGAAADAHVDDIELSGDFVVWAASPEAAFLHGRLVWCNWDVDEMKQRKGELEGTKLLTTTLEGWSSFKYHSLD
ncbi:Short chain dehydrogenase andI [Lachnellula suecica]|uniref:Short chain dehydrogenase andI n=1 Tax=Lachnellula suecica TaxID=602035 RepID=A0A8T9BRH6_9HELO|nr:Short chain dehydrogenase andI [Lachnellula suecica]